MDEQRKALFSGLAAWAGIIIALLTSGVSTIVVFGELKGQVRQNTKEIAEMKDDSRTLTRDVGDIKITVTEIKTKLDLLLPTTPEKPK